MKILVLHNYYKNPGGEDVVFDQECALLEKNGHEVIRYVEYNSDIDKYTNFTNSMNAVWSHETYLRISRIIKKEKPDVAHFHNIFFRISPSAYYACRENSVPVIQTLHNYRLICSNALLYRDNKTCELCIGKKIPFFGILFSCYKKSFLYSLLINLILIFHNLKYTWKTKVDIYIAPTQFVKDKYVQGGFPGNKIIVKPNFILDKKESIKEDREYALFVGRLVEEKGLKVLLDAWQNLTSIPLFIVGDGPMYDYIDKCKPSNVKLLGYKSSDALADIYKKSRFLIFPSVWYETFGLTIIESFLYGTPVIAANHGAMTESVKDGVNGLLFKSGSVEDLIVKVKWAWSHEKEMEEMGRNARSTYEANYIYENNYKALHEIYLNVIKKYKAY